MDELRIELIIDPGAEVGTPGSLSFEMGPSEAPWCYDALEPGALTSLYEDLALGAPLPLRFVTHGIRGPHTIVAMGLFTQRDLLLHPGTSALVYNAELYRRHGVPAGSHMALETYRLLRFLSEYCPPDSSRSLLAERLPVAFGWLRDTLEERPPHLGESPPSPIVRNVGTNGFVVAEGVPEEDVWVELYRNGYLRGVVFGPDQKVLISAKSPRVGWPLERVMQRLNLLEPNGRNWILRGSFVQSPAGGTEVSYSTILEALLRC